ncbi:MAG: hypothetical protein AAFQ85_13535, partial [Pseudomonadota bacterium]
AVALEETQEEHRALKDEVVRLTTELAVKAAAIEAAERRLQAASGVPAMQRVAGAPSASDADPAPAATLMSITPLEAAGDDGALPSGSGDRPRPSETVVAALDGAPGMSSVTAAQRAALQASLEGGACVTDALHRVFGTVNRQVAVFLIRKLPNC